MWHRSPPRPRRARQSLPTLGWCARPCAVRPQVEALEYRRLLSGTVTLAPNDDSVLVGERVTWTAATVGVATTPVYQFSAAPQGGTFHVLRDYSPANAFAWTPA